MTAVCPGCGSGHTRRGGTAIWLTYMILVSVAMVAVLMFHLHAGLVGGVMLALIVVAHLVFDQRVCLDCGHQWAAKRS